MITLIGSESQATKTSLDKGEFRGAHKTKKRALVFLPVRTGNVASFFVLLASYDFTATPVNTRAS